MNQPAPRNNLTDQEWNPKDYAHHASFVPELGEAVLQLLSPRKGERILDLGCGDGILTEKIAASGAHVIAIDSSPAMVEAARQRGLDARLGRGEALAFEAEFDAVFSNAALHWMQDADAVTSGVARALKPGGRFVGEFGGHGNVAAIIVALLAVLERRGVAIDGVIPWYFPTPKAYRSQLERNAFIVTQISLLPRPTLLATGIEGWLRTFGQHFFQRISPNPHEPNAREKALEEAVRLLRPALCDESGCWTADYVRLRFSAYR